MPALVFFERMHMGIDTDSLDQRKRALRALVRARLPAPGSPEQVAASLAAQERLAGSDLAAQAKVIALYRALPSECGTAALASALQAAGKEICYPCVLPRERALTFRRGAGVFVAGALGIEEPSGTPVPLAEIDLIVVPAIAVDDGGGRLGRGRGHYDATLAITRAVSIALVFDSQLVDEVPLGEDDRPVDAVCTESRLFVVP
jgi:5-formyltetrahydrofolate cyclo-ligase